MRTARTETGQSLDSFGIQFDLENPQFAEFKESHPHHWEWDRKDDSLHPCTTGRWAEMHENHFYRVVGKTQVRAWGKRKCNVSTVFLGTDHGYGRGAPILFETMIFGGPLDEEQDRFCTVHEARVAHVFYIAIATISMWCWPMARGRDACLNTCVFIYRCLRRCGLLRSAETSVDSMPNSYGGSGESLTTGSGG